jgi:hypothetical protein
MKKLSRHELKVNRLTQELDKTWTELGTANTALENVRTSIKKADNSIHSLEHKKTALEFSGEKNTTKLAEIELEIYVLKQQSVSLSGLESRLIKQNSDIINEYNVNSANLNKTINSGNRPKLFSVRNATGRGFKAVGSVGIGAARNAVKGGVGKIDPFSGGINKGDVSDTGMESIRAGRQLMTKTKNTIKTTRRNLKTVKNMPKQAYKAAKATVRVMIEVTRFIITATTHLIAVVTNPFFWKAIGILIILGVLAGGVIILLSNFNPALIIGSTISGVLDENTDYADALTTGTALFDTDTAAQQAAYVVAVNAPFYSTSADSDLIYYHIQVNNDTTQISPFSSGIFATDLIETWLISQWDLQISANEALAITYVLLQRQANVTAGSENQIYPVTFTNAEIGVVTKSRNSRTKTRFLL